MFEEVKRCCVEPLQIVEEQRQRMFGPREYPEKSPECQLETDLSLLRRKLTPLGTWALIQDGTNDAYGGRTLAQMQADIQAACLVAKNRGLKVAGS